jgi:dipeptidyl aminopeptidase/acylaminoacyl peptidase
MRHLVCAAILLILPPVASAQEKTVPVPAGIKLEGMPAIPQSIADGLGIYAQFRSAQLQAWHPAKRQIVITTAFGPTPQLHFVDGPGRDRKQLTWFPGSGISTRYVSPSFDPADPNTFVFLFDPAGGEARSIYRYDMTAGQAALAVDAQSRYAPVWSKQGKWLAYDSAERNGRDRELYIVQPSDAKTKRRLADLEGPWSPQDWSPDGSMLLALEVFANNETYIWRFDVKTGEKTAITPRNGEKARWFFPRFSADGRRIYAISDRGGETMRVWRGDLATGAWTAVTGPTDEVEYVNGGFELSPDGTQMAVVFDRGATTELQVIDLTTLKPRPLPALTRGVVTQLHWRPGAREIGFTLGSVKAQGDAYSIDTSLGTLTRWTNSETTFNAELLPVPEVVEWKSTDGLAISGLLYKPSPKFTGKRAVMVQIHGGPDAREQAIFRGRSNYFLNELGVALLYPNVRGSLGFGRKFAELDNGRGRDGAIKDIGTMLDWIATRPDLDAGRVVLQGPSYGGWLALQAGIVYNDRIRGIIEGAGITDFITYLEQTPAARQENRRAEYGDERDPQMREYLKSISPVTRASELKKPTMILHPGKDPRVPVAQAQELLKALKANNATVWYAEFTEANHDNFPGSAPANDFMIASWILFFKTFVLN